MAGDEIARLDFATNIAQITAEVARSLEQLQTQLESAGSRAGTKAQIGEGFTTGLQRLIGATAEAGGQIEQTVTKSLDSLAKLSDLKGPTTLGGQFGGMIAEVIKAADVLGSTLDSTSRKQLGGQSAIRAQLAEPIIALIEQLKVVQRIVNERIAQMSAEQAAIFQRFVNPGQITAAINRGEAYVQGTGLPKYDPAAATTAATRAAALLGSQPVTTTGISTASDELASQAGRLANSMRYTENEGKGTGDAFAATTASLRAYDKWLQQQILKGQETGFAEGARPGPEAGTYLIGQGDQAQLHVRPPVASLVEPGAKTGEGLDAAGQDYLQSVEQEGEAFRTDAKQNQRERALRAEATQILTQRAREEADDRAAAIAQNKRIDAEIARARLAQLKAEEQAGTEPRSIQQIGKGPYYANDQGGFEKLTPTGIGPIRAGSGEEEKAIQAYVAATSVAGTAARKLAQLQDRASQEMNRSIEAERQRVSSEETFAALLKKQGLGANFAAENPGDRDLGNGYYQVGAILKKRTQSGQQVVTSDEDLFRAQEALVRTLAAEQRLAQGGTSGGAAVDPRRGSVFDSFLGGAFGHGFDTSQPFDPKLALGNLAATAGVLARYGYEFKIIQAGLNTIKTSFTELATYQEKLVGLQEAIQSTTSGEIDLTAAFGANADAGVTANQAIEIGTAGLLAYRSELSQGVSANQIFATSVEAVGEAMVLTGKDAAAAQKDLVASTNSFQIGSQGQGRILDAVVNAVRNYGGNRGEVLNAVATAAGAAQEAGISPEELANISALIQSRTGDSGSTTASSINRLIARQDNATFRSALGRLGIEETGNVSKEITELSTAYQKLNPLQQQSLITSLGGARALKDLLPILQSGSDLLANNARSNERAGAAADEFGKIMGSLSGQFKQFKAVFADIETNLGRSGIFAGLEVALLALKPALQGVNDLFILFNTILPSSARTVVGVVADIVLLGGAIELMQKKIAGTAALKATIGGSQAVVAAGSVGVADASLAPLNAQSGALERNVALRQQALGITEAQAAVDGGVTGVITAQTGALAARNAMALEGSVAGGLGAVPAGITGEGIEASQFGSIGGNRLASLGITGGGAIAGLLTSPLTYAIVGLIAIGGVTDHVHQLSKAMDDSKAGLDTLAKAKTPSDFQGAADQLQAAAKEQRKGGGGLFGPLASLFQDDGNLQARADYAKQQAKKIAADATQVPLLTQASFGATGTDIAAGLSAMKDQGVDANTQLHAVAQALGLVSNKATSAAGALDAHGSPQGLTYTDALLPTLVGTAAGGKFLHHEDVGVSTGDIHRDGGDTTRYIDPQSHSEVILQSPQAKALDAKLKAALANVAAGAVLSDEDKNRIATTIADAYHFDGSTAKQIAADRDKIRQNVLQKLADENAQTLLQETGPLDPSSLASIVAGLTPVISQAAQANPLTIGSAAHALGGPGNGASALAILQHIKGQADAAGSKTTDSTAYQTLLLEIATIQDQYIQAKVADLEKLRQSAEKHAGVNISAILGVRHDYFATEIAASASDQNVLVGIFNQMTQSEINLFLAKYREEVALARAALESEQNLLAAIQQRSGDTQDPRLLQGRSNAIAAARAKFDSVTSAYKNLTVADKNASPQDSVAAADAALQKAQAAELARINAGADPRNPVQQAQTALNAAKTALGFIKDKTSADYWNGVKAVNDAQYQLAQAQQAQAAAALQASVFPGSKMQAAAAEIRTAAGELALAEQGTADYFKAVGDMRKAQLDYALAIADRNHINRLLHIDITNPLAQAKEAIRQAQDQYNADKAQGAPADVLNADREKIREAKTSEQQTAFDQKMQDEKTAFDLQQISATTYLQFLEHQRTVLQSIHHKTRQQIDELNQVDQAIKSMSSQLAGQFNIGDIKVPTPYEVRRFLAGGLGVGGTQVVAQNTTVTINGADYDKVRALIMQLVGQQATVRIGTAPRKA